MIEPREVTIKAILDSNVFILGVFWKDARTNRSDRRRCFRGRVNLARSQATRDVLRSFFTTFLLRFTTHFLRHDREPVS
jgi:hypothetical protein